MSKAWFDPHPPYVSFWCPGCNKDHTVNVTPGPGWGWNESLEEPTFTPSVKVEAVQWSEGDHFYMPTHPNIERGKPTCCHSFVTAGKIQFLADCTHALAGQTVELPQRPE